MKRLAVAVLCAALAGCSSLPPLPRDPTPERPIVACIADSPFAPKQKLSATGNRLLPEIVRLIGVTPDADGGRWMVLRAGEFDPENWQPWEKSRIQTFGCGPEADAMREVMDGSRGAAPADPVNP